jgi:hypothetical protein
MRSFDGPPAGISAADFLTPVYPRPGASFKLSAREATRKLFNFLGQTKNLSFQTGPWKLFLATQFEITHFVGTLVRTINKTLCKE